MICIKNCKICNDPCALLNLPLPQKVKNIIVTDRYKSIIISLIVIAILSAWQAFASGQDIAVNTQFQLPVTTPSGSVTIVTAVYFPGYLVYSDSTGKITTIALGTCLPPAPVVPPAPPTPKGKVFGAVFEDAAYQLTPDQTKALNSTKIPIALGGRWKILGPDTVVPAELKSFADAVKNTPKPALLMVDEAGNIIINKQLPATNSEDYILSLIK